MIIRDIRPFRESTLLKRERTLIPMEDIQNQYNFKPGTRVMITIPMHQSGPKPTDMLEKRIGVVKDVYSRFIVIDFGAYCESFNKVDFMVSKPEAMIDVV